MKKNQNLQVQRTLTVELNLEGVKRKNKNVKMDTRIERATEIYEIKGDMERFLRNVSYVILYKWNK